MVTENSIVDFGKYKGMAIKDIPANYLWWCYHNDRLPPDVRKYVKANYHKYTKLNKDGTAKKENKSSPDNGKGVHRD